MRLELSGGRSWKRRLSLTRLIRRRGRGAPIIRWPLEIGAIGVATAIWAGGEYIRVRRAPTGPVEREAQRMLNRLDRRARGALLANPERAEIANRVSNAVAYAAVPLASGLALYCLDRADGPLIADGLKVTRSVLMTGAVNQVIKFVAPRERPFVLANPGARGNDRYGSFFSNHTSAVSAMATAAAGIAWSRGSSPWFGLPLYGLALFVGYLRIAADRHFLTDVLAGFAFGAGVGAVFGR